MKKKLLVLLVSVFAVTSFNSASAQQEGMIGEMKMFAGNFAPRTWMKCEGQLLPISEYTALFSVIGTYYGGDGRTTFALPDMRGRVAMGTGTGIGLSPSVEGQMQGQETTTLTTQNMPAHNHTVEAQQNEPVEVLLAREPDTGAVVVNHPISTSPNQTSTAGGNTPLNNMQPSLSVSYIICVQGTYPSRN